MMTTISYKLEKFEGPLDLLLSLISKNKIDINDIPIALLCDQYMDYLAKAEKFDIELSSDFIVMASELMLIKSRMLLPRIDEDEEDPRAALAAYILEYKRAKEASTLLGELYSQYGLRMAKETDEISVDKTFVADHDAALLAAAYNRVLTQIKTVSDAEAKKKFDPLIKPAQIVSVAEVVGELTKKLVRERRFSLGSYFGGAASKGELITMFMAMLELLRTGLLVLEEAHFSENGVINASSEDVSVTLPEGADENALTAAAAEMA